MENAWNTTFKELRPLVAIIVGLMLVTAVAYPLVVTGVGQLVFHRQANGSIVSVDGTDVGSSLIGQQFTEPQYFHPRPSAAGDGYDASASSGSNLGPTSDKLINGIHDPNDPSSDFDGIKDRVAAYRTENGLSDDVPIPSDAVTASASGLDPHISPANARLQIARVAKARGASDSDIKNLVDDQTEGRVFGFIGEPRVNVLKLNMALDQKFPMSK